MPSLRDIRRRIRSVESTQQITKAMKMVAASKLKKTESLLVAFRPYADGYGHTVSRIASQLKQLKHPYLDSGTEKEESSAGGRKIGLVVLSADRGLCGAYNSAINQHASRFIREHKKDEITVVAVGRKNRDFFRKVEKPVEKEYVNMLGIVDYSIAEIISQDLLQLWREKNLEAIYILYTRYRSAINQEIVVEQLLPVKPPVETGSNEVLDKRPYLFEPDVEEVLGTVLERNMTVHLYRALLESSTSEHGARMTAMDNATENAGDIINDLTLSMNRARQAQITKELSEIVSGADALEG